MNFYFEKECADVSNVLKHSFVYTSNTWEIKGKGEDSLGEEEFYFTSQPIKENVIFKKILSQDFRGIWREMQRTPQTENDSKKYHFWQHLWRKHKDFYCMTE